MSTAVTHMKWKAYSLFHFNPCSSVVSLLFGNQTPMIRYSAFDPPEYINWQADSMVAEQFAQTIEQNAERRQIISQLSATQLVALYEGLVRNRLHDIALKRWVKQGVISKAWLGTGEEAATVGPVHALNREPFGDGLPVDFT